MSDYWIDSLTEFFRRQPKTQHIWKEERHENLGSFTHYGSNIHDICTMYRIAVHERCLLTGETRIREKTDLFPASSSEQDSG